MLRVLPLVLALVLAPPVLAAEAVRYVSDELVIVMRDSAGTSGAVVTSLNSGTRLQLLETDTANGYGRVRLADGRTGWVQLRYLSTTPPARERAAAADKQLAQAQSELKTLQEAHARLLKDFDRISEGRPPPPPEAVTRELESLRAQTRELGQQNESLRNQGGQARDRQRMLLLGGGLVVIGFVLAWLVRWLWPKRRWGDF